jgi:hypothetical protein
MVYIGKDFEKAVLCIKEFVEEKEDADYTQLKDLIIKLPYDYCFKSPILGLLELSRGNSARFKRQMYALGLKLEEKPEDEPLAPFEYIRAVEIECEEEEYRMKFPDMATVHQKMAEKGGVPEQKAVSFMKRVHQPV